MFMGITASRYIPDLKTIGFKKFPMSIYKIISRTFPRCDNSSMVACFHFCNNTGSIALWLAGQALVSVRPD